MADTDVRFRQAARLRYMVSCYYARIPMTEPTEDELAAWEERLRERVEDAKRGIPLPDTLAARMSYEVLLAMGLWPTEVSHEPEPHGWMPPDEEPLDPDVEYMAHAGPAVG